MRDPVLSIKQIDQEATPIEQIVSFLCAEEMELLRACRPFFKNIQIVPIFMFESSWAEHTSALEEETEEAGIRLCGCRVDAQSLGRSPTRCEGKQNRR